MKNFLRHRKTIMDIVKIILKDGYDYNKIVLDIVKYINCPLSSSMMYYQGLAFEAKHIKTERKNGKIIITFEGKF